MTRPTRTRAEPADVLFRAVASYVKKTGGTVLIARGRAERLRQAAFRGREAFNAPNVLCFHLI